MLFINIMEHCSNLERMESCSGLNEEFEHLVHSGGSVFGRVIEPFDGEVLMKKCIGRSEV